MGLTEMAGVENVEGANYRDGKCRRTNYGKPNMVLKFN